MRLGRLAAAALLAAVALLAPAASAQRTGDAKAPTRIEIAAKPIAAFEPRHADRRQFGPLRFRGGLSLSSSYPGFGGLSGLRLAPDGEHFIAISDKADWLRGRIIYRNGVPVGITDAEMAPMIGPDGRTLAARRWYDTESLARDGGTLYVGIERSHHIVKFDYGKRSLTARGQPLRIPPAIRSLPRNKGIEALAVIPKGLPRAGTLIAISERGLDAQGNIRSWLIGGAAPGEFTLVRRDDFDVTDATITPDGDLIILERFFSFLQGVAMRMRRVPLSALKPGAVLDGTILITADMGFQIDNMEGLSAHRSPEGETVLTLISDDNFSLIQRTLLLQFTLTE
ncbi:MAG: esterase-like activity of phytase family protein [Rhizobiales bacterium]|nr:esterase-like activity of phytase family protein [Hyphomicrobiales bacterium]